MKEPNRSFLFVIAAYTSWGLLPLYWKLLASVPASTVLAHRVLGSVIFLGMLLWFRGTLRSSFNAFTQLSMLKRLACSVPLICSNWLIYVWAMGNGRIIESGLGYFICPMMTVAFGAILLGEWLSRRQTVALGVVLAGVMLKVCAVEQFPWVALGLAGSFALYMTARKAYATDPLCSLFQEVALALPVVLAVVYYWNRSHHWFGHGLLEDFLLVLAGPITALPLLCLVSGLKHVPLQAAAISQYIAPTLTVVMGLLAGENLMPVDAVALPVIWLGIGLYLMWHPFSRKRKAAMRAEYIEIVPAAKLASLPGERPILTRPLRHP